MEKKLEINMCKLIISFLTTGKKKSDFISIIIGFDSTFFTVQSGVYICKTQALITRNSFVGRFIFL